MRNDEKRIDNFGKSRTEFDRLSRRQRSQYKRADKLYCDRYGKEPNDEYDEPLEYDGFLEHWLYSLLGRPAILSDEGIYTPAAYVQEHGRIYRASGGEGL